MRQALFPTLAIVFAVSCGCESPDRNEKLGPLPGPVLSTRPPEQIAPIPRPAPAPPPSQSPMPEPISGEVRLRDIMPPGGIQRGKWQIIVVHHSAARNSTPQGMDSWHRQRGWSGGLGYHFVIGNGAKYPDGQLYVGPRWKSQSTGAHCKNSAGKYLGVWRDRNFFNDRGIGICLVGDFQSEQPTARQLATLRDLTALLIQQTNVPPGAVWGHGEITHKTACPGRNMNMTTVRRSAGAAVGLASPPAFDELIPSDLHIQLASDEPCEEQCCCCDDEPGFDDGVLKAIHFN